jgi:hypothetical protein
LNPQFSILAYAEEKLFNPIFEEKLFNIILLKVASTFRLDSNA